MGFRGKGSPNDPPSAIALRVIAARRRLEEAESDLGIYLKRHDRRSWHEVVGCDPTTLKLRPTPCECGSTIRVVRKSKDTEIVERLGRLAENPLRVRK